MSRYRRVTGRERGTYTRVDPDTNEPKFVPWATGRDTLECFHETAIGYPLTDARRRLCRVCGPTCDCGMCRHERGVPHGCCALCRRAADAHLAVEELIALGVLGRWWCDLCADWVPYRTELGRTVLDNGGKPGMAYGEEASRLVHAARHREERP